MSSYAREQRRAYEKWLRKTDINKYREWKSESIERGNKIHQENVERVRQQESENYEKRQTEMIENLREKGYSDSEIDEHVEGWVSSIKPWASGVKLTRKRHQGKEKVEISTEELDGE
jgi:hypothetical protein